MLAIGAFSTSDQLIRVYGYQSGIRQVRSQRRSWFSLIIPGMASVMYTCSLAHWAVSFRSFKIHDPRLQNHLKSTSLLSLDSALLVLLSINVRIIS